MSSASSALYQLKRYKPSGTMPIFGTAAMFVVSVCAGAILGAVYAFVNHHDPLIYLNALLAIGLSWLLGWIVSKGVRVFRIRNGAAAIVIGFAAFLSAYLTHWPVYVATVLVDYGDMGVSSYDVKAIAELSVEMAKTPELLWELVYAFNEEGIWSITSGSSGSSGMEVKGILLTLIWIAEAVTICWSAILKPYAVAIRPYSERQEKWLEPKSLPGRVAFIENKEEFYNALLRGDYSALTTPLPAGEEHGQQYAMVELYADPFEPYVTVTNVSAAGGETTKPREGLGKKLFRWLIRDSSKSRGETSKHDVVQYLKISSTVAQNIMNALC